MIWRRVSTALARICVSYRKIKEFEAIAIVTLVRLGALGAFSLIDGHFEHNEWVSRFYLPAGVNVLLCLAFGPVAALGVAFGSLLWNAFLEDYPAWTGLALAATSGLSCLLSLAFFSRVFPNWVMPLSA